MSNTRIGNLHPLLIAAVEDALGRHRPRCHLDSLQHMHVLLARYEAALTGVETATGFSVDPAAVRTAAAELVAEVLRRADKMRVGIV